MVILQLDTLILFIESKTTKKIYLLDDEKM